MVKIMFPLLPHLLFSTSDALTYVKDQLSIVGNTRVKILTSQGNILVSLVTVTEAIDYKVSEFINCLIIFIIILVLIK